MSDSGTCILKGTSTAAEVPGCERIYIEMYKQVSLPDRKGWTRTTGVKDYAPSALPTELHSIMLFGFGPRISINLCVVKHFFIKGVNILAFSNLLSLHDSIIDTDIL